MSVALITGSAGLIGSEASAFFAKTGMLVIGIDNNMRQFFFGEEGSTCWQREHLVRELGSRYRHFDVDIRDKDSLEAIFKQYQNEISLVIHAAAQPSHDWAVRDPLTDFTVNANGTLNTLEATRKYSPQAVFIFTSTNKVYGDAPNHLPLIEKESRWEIDPSHPYVDGIREDMSIDQHLHSLFGASKVAADIVVQEYGRYFGLKTTCLRGGCMTGPNHAGAKLHGFLAYLMKCTALGRPYTIYGYKGKQVRDNIHSADLIQAMYAIFKKPRPAEVYNIGGGRYSNCSMLEAIEHCQEITGRKLDWSYTDTNRIGDHIWYVSGMEKFMAHYPEWKITYDIPSILRDIYEKNLTHWEEH